MSALQRSSQHESDSEDDLDYVPPDVNDEHSSDDDDRESKRPRTGSHDEPTLEPERLDKKAREALWADFQTSASTPPSRPANEPNKMIMIEKKYRFAGEDVIEVKEVAADSEEAQKWPVWQSPESNDKASPIAAVEPAASTFPEIHADVDTSQHPVVPDPPQPLAGRKPVRRKPKVQLAALPSSSAQKPKKLTTLEKSAIDWQAHVGSKEDPQLQDELEANRRTGGYLEKMQFLQRVEDRKDQAFDASRDKKRRRG